MKANKSIGKVLTLSFIICHLSFSPVRAQSGAPYIHDPSTLAECDGKWYTFGTGGGGIITDDGWSWHSGAERPGGGAAPDILKIGDRYLCIYGATGGGLFGGHNGRILTMWNKTLDPKSPDFKWSTAIEVASSDGMEDCDAIDPCLLLDPTTGRLWATYGTYFGNIRLIELDPKTGERVKGNVEKDVAIDCEASALMYKDGWYYLLGTHGTCCDGVNSTYNITGAGHFGRYIIDEGVEVMSFHWEADFELSGRSVLAVRPVLWKNGWPYAGERFRGGTYAILSERRGYSLEMAVDFVRIQQERQRGFGNRNQPMPPAKPIPNQSLEDVISTWPAADASVAVRCSDYMFRPHQLWTFTPVEEAGGYLTAPYFKITIAGTDRALTATADKELATMAYQSNDEQLWRIEQLTDGTYRIMPKHIPGIEGINTRYCLYSAADSTPTLAVYDFSSDNSKWNLKRFASE